MCRPDPRWKDKALATPRPTATPASVGRPARTAAPRWDNACNDLSCIVNFYINLHFFTIAGPTQPRRLVWPGQSAPRGHPRARARGDRAVPAQDLVTRVLATWLGEHALQLPPCHSTYNRDKKIWQFYSIIIQAGMLLHTFGRNLSNEKLETANFYLCLFNLKYTFSVNVLKTYWFEVKRRFLPFDQFQYYLNKQSAYQNHL